MTEIMRITLGLSSGWGLPQPRSLRGDGAREGLLHKGTSRHRPRVLRVPRLTNFPPAAHVASPRQGGRSSGPLQLLPLSAGKALIVPPICGLCTKFRFSPKNASFLEKPCSCKSKSSALSEYCLCCAFLKIHPESQLISLFLLVSASPEAGQGPDSTGRGHRATGKLRKR